MLDQEEEGLKVKDGQSNINRQIILVYLLEKGLVATVILQSVAAMAKIYLVKPLRKYTWGFFVEKHIWKC